MILGKPFRRHPHLVFCTILDFRSWPFLRQADAIRRKKLGRPRFYGIIAAATIVAIVVLAIVIDSAVYYNKIHAGVSISGLSMGGSTPDEATAQLNQVVDKAQKRPIPLTSGDKKWTVLPTDVGTKIDVEGAVVAAMEESRDSNFFADLGHRLKLYFTDVDIPMTGTIDDAMMDKVLGDLTAQLNTAPVNAGLTLEAGEVKVIEGQKGQTVDKDKLSEELQSLVLTLHTTELEVPLKEVDPVIQAQDTQEAVGEAETMISGPVVLTSDEKSWSITPSQIGSYMEFTTAIEGGVST